MYVDKATRQRLYTISSGLRSKGFLSAIHLGPCFTMYKYNIVKTSIGHGLDIRSQSSTRGSKNNMHNVNKYYIIDQVFAQKSVLD